MIPVDITSITNDFEYKTFKLSISREFNYDKLMIVFRNFNKLRFGPSLMSHMYLYRALVEAYNFDIQDNFHNTLLLQSSRCVYNHLNSLLGHFVYGNDDFSSIDYFTKQLKENDWIAQEIISLCRNGCVEVNCDILIYLDNFAITEKDQEYINKSLTLFMNGDYDLNLFNSVVDIDKGDYDIFLHNFKNYLRDKKPNLSIC